MRTHAHDSSTVASARSAAPSRTPAATNAAPARNTFSATRAPDACAPGAGAWFESQPPPRAQHLPVPCEVHDRVHAAPNPRDDFVLPRNYVARRRLEAAHGPRVRLRRRSSYRAATRPVVRPVIRLVLRLVVAAAVPLPQQRLFAAAAGAPAAAAPRARHRALLILLHDGPRGAAAAAAACGARSAGARPLRAADTAMHFPIAAAAGPAIRRRPFRLRLRRAVTVVHTRRRDAYTGVVTGRSAAPATAAAATAAATHRSVTRHPPHRHSTNFRNHGRLCRSPAAGAVCP